MALKKSEALALGIINLGLSILMGFWLGFSAFLISFIVVYVTIGLSANGGCYSETSLWNWFFQSLDISFTNKI